jgi:S1-C subfamily serine protease
VLPQLLRSGRVSRAFLGIHGRTVPIPRYMLRTFRLTQPGGVEVVSLETGSPADRAGLRAGDILVSVGAESVGGMDDLQRHLNHLIVGKETAVTLLREGTLLERTLMPAEFPQA